MFDDSNATTEQELFWLENQDSINRAIQYALTKYNKFVAGMIRSGWLERGDLEQELHLKIYESIPWILQNTKKGSSSNWEPYFYKVATAKLIDIYRNYECRNIKYQTRVLSWEQLKNQLEMEFPDMDPKLVEKFSDTSEYNILERISFYEDLSILLLQRIALLERFLRQVSPGLFQEYLFEWYALRDAFAEDWGLRKAGDERGEG